MKNWIEVTNSYGQPMFVNLDNVRCIETGNTEFACIRFSDDHIERCKELYSDVVLMIHRAGEDEISIQHTERVGNVEVRETIYQQSNDVPVRVAAPPDNSFVKRADCSSALRMQGNVAVPRTCKACGLGPCKYGR